MIDKRSVRLQIPSQTLEKAGYYCRANNMTLSRLAERAIAYYLEKQNEKR